MTVPPPIRLGLFLFCGAGLLVLALMPQPPVSEGHGVDKVEHALAFALLAVLGVWALPWRAWRTVALLVAFGVLIEILQAILPFGRDGDPFDVLADCVGVAIGVTAELWVLRRTRRP